MKSILFSGPRVHAILAGIKSQTRRVVKPSYNADRAPISEWREQDGVWFGLNGYTTVAHCRCPYGEPGDLLWVRESWAAPHAFDHLPPRLIPAGTNFHYRATEDGPSGLLWRSPIHMPRWASRITLEITDRRIERLQDISDEDAIAEGLERDDKFPLLWKRGRLHGDQNILKVTAFLKLAYRSIWESIHGAGSWEVNPFVWVISFKLVK